MNTPVSPAVEEALAPTLSGFAAYLPAMRVT